MNKQKIVIFGAGNKGKIAIATLKYEKEIIGVIDNDKLKWGKTIDGFRIYSLEESKGFLNGEVQIVIAAVPFAEIVLQLEENELHNYIYFEDVYANNFSCKSRKGTAPTDASAITAQPLFMASLATAPQPSFLSLVNR